MQLEYAHKGTVTTFIDVDFKSNKVKIKNYTNNIIQRAFGVVENPTIDDFNSLLERRCFPPTRDKMKLILRELELDYYDPLCIIRKTEGQMAGDFFTLKIIKE